MALDSEFTAVVQCLGCLRGVSTLTAFGLAVEVGDRKRFTGSNIGAYLGLLPSEHTSGAARSRGWNWCPKPRRPARIPGIGACISAGSPI